MTEKLWKKKNDDQTEDTKEKNDSLVVINSGSQQPGTGKSMDKLASLHKRQLSRGPGVYICFLRL